MYIQLLDELLVLLLLGCSLSPTHLRFVHIFCCTNVLNTMNFTKNPLPVRYVCRLYRCNIQLKSVIESSNVYTHGEWRSSNNNNNNKVCHSKFRFVISCLYFLFPIFFLTINCVAVADRLYHLVQWQIQHHSMEMICTLAVHQRLPSLNRICIRVY